MGYPFQGARVRSLLLLSSVALVLSACPSGEEPLGDPSGSAPGADAGPEYLTEACGTPPAAPVEPNPCRTFTDCAAGSNLASTSGCTRCVRQASRELCEAGECVPYERTGNIQAGFEAPPSTVGARSIIVSTYGPTAGDGTTLTCEGLLSPLCDPNRDEALNAINVNLLEIPNGINDRTPNFTPIVSTRVGTNNVVLVQILRASDGAGSIMAEGCLDGIEVREGETTQVEVELESTGT